MVIFFSYAISFSPVWKCVWGGPPCRTEKFSYSASPRIKLLQQTTKRFQIEFIPLGRDSLGNVQQHLHSDFGFKFGQPWLEGFDSSHLFVDCWPKVETPSRRVGEIPFAGVETEALVNHYGAMEKVFSLSKKHRLATICVAGPLVKHQHAAKVRDVLKIGEETSRQQVSRLALSRVYREARPKT